MAKHEAVDRLIAMATEKRADRIPAGVQAAESPVRAPIDTPVAGNSPGPSRPPGTPPGAELPSVLAPKKAMAQVSRPAGPTATERGRQLLQAIRPLLPAVAGAMRLIDHGAVQALAKLLPLLGGAGVTTVSSSPAASPAQQALLEQLQSEHEAARRDLDALAATVSRHTAAAEDQMGRFRTQMERLVSAQMGRDTELRALSERARLLTAGVIILLMLIVAQMILVVVLVHQ